jgi:hypothetical protein
MGNNKKPTNESRRQFFVKLLGSQGEKVKLLTPDGKLVEVDKAVVQAASQNKKASNKDIYDWMQNPSKNKQ